MELHNDFLLVTNAIYHTTNLLNIMSYILRKECIYKKIASGALVVPPLRILRHM